MKRLLGALAIVLLTAGTAVAGHSFAVHINDRDLDGHYRSTDNRRYDVGSSSNYRWHWNDRGVERIEKRLRRQRRRIRMGWHNGELTPREMRKLRRQQGRIHEFKWQAMRDGWLSRYEVHELERMLDRASDRIYRFKHNSRRSRYYSSRW